MTERIYCPGPEFLNLSFGVVVSLGVNILSTVALADGKVPFTTVVCIACLLLSSVAIGALALVSSKIRDDALLVVGATLTDSERRAEVRQVVQARGAQVLALEVGAVVPFIAGVALLFGSR